jgi:ribose transport system ATP-binding protein
MMGEEIRHALEVDGLRKVYGGEAALVDVSLNVRAGEVHGLLGANGAGKSTLIKIVSGVENQDAGTVTVNGTTLPAPHSVAEVRAAGCAYIHQDRALVPALTIAENISLSLGFPVRGGMINMRATRNLAEEAMQRVGLRASVDSPVSELPIAEQTLVAIARALAADAELLLLDEPTANLGGADAKMLYERVRTLSQGGTACVLITHHLEEALDICDRVSVLRDGRHVATRDASDLDQAELTKLMVGAKYLEAITDTPAPGRARMSEKPTLVLEGIGILPSSSVSLEVHPGEILGVTGLPDSGHLELGEIIIGERRPFNGTMRLEGEAYHPSSARQAIEHDVAFVPSDRIRDGLATTMTLRENLFLGATPDGRRMISAGVERRRASQILDDFGVKPAEPEAELSTLSGGNMQKVLLAKWLIQEPRLLVLCEPTVGVDIGARADIYDSLRQAAKDGVAILLLSSDQDEVVELSDRALVLRFGEIRGELVGAHMTAERLGAASQGWMPDSPPSITKELR